MRVVSATIGLTLLAGSAHAGEVTLDLPGDVEDSSITYACESGQVMEVRYVNGGKASLAIFDWDGERYVASAAISGSGVRYVGDRFVWWNKGEEATLYDELAGADAEPLVTCLEQ